MADIKEYKCPACGGAMEFDSKSQKMKCPFCDTVVDMSEFEEADAGNKAKQNKQEGNAAEGDQGAEGKPEGR